MGSASLTCFDTGQAEVGPHQELPAATELLDLPDERRLVGSILDGTRRRLRIINIQDAVSRQKRTAP